VVPVATVVPVAAAAAGSSSLSDGRSVLEIMPAVLLLQWLM